MHYSVFSLTARMNMMVISKDTKSNGYIAQGEYCNAIILAWGESRLEAFIAFIDQAKESLL